MTAPILEAEGLHKGYGRLPVLKGVSLTVAAGERHVIIGPNGAGKTTLFKVLSGELFPDRGRIRFEGRDVTAEPGFRRVRQGFGRSFQVARIFAGMTVLENVLVAVEAGEGGVAWGIRPSRSARARADEVLAQLGLTGAAGTAASVLSHGDKKRLELAMSLALRPRILFLDEPTAGMSPADRQAAVKLIDRLVRDSGMTLVLTEHDMGVVFDLGTRLSVLHYGEVVASGEPSAVRADPMVRQIYLGGAAGHA